MERVNRYCCDTCHGNIITVDRDKGVTAFMVGCRATADCKGTMISRFYRVESIWGPPTFEWRKPSPEQYGQMGETMRTHVDRGGLCIYPIAETVEG